MTNYGKYNKARRELELLRAGKSTDEMHYSPLLCTRKDWQKPMPSDDKKDAPDSSTVQSGGL
ncbi:MAG: hypothetical protein WC455_18055 [Dehalococcoidia bacterium]|jgi:hypothetical protein